MFNVNQPTSKKKSKKQKIKKAKQSSESGHEQNLQLKPK